jgi:hypothetical protein
MQRPIFPCSPRLRAVARELAVDRGAAWEAGVLAAAAEIRAAEWEAVQAPEKKREAWAAEWGVRKINPAQVTKEKVDHTLEAQGPPQALQAPPAVRGPRA